MTRVDSTRPDTLVVVGEYLYRGDAEIHLALLRSEGISAFVRADDEGGLNPGFFSEYRVALIVKQSDEPAARSLLGTGETIIIPGQVRQAMESHAGWAEPSEACGLFAGTGNRVALVFCLSNRLVSRTRYSIDPREHFGAMRYAERCGLEVLGAWHSHPGGAADLSATDIALSPGGDWVTVVVGAAGRVPIRAYRTRGTEVIELAVVEELSADGTA